MKITGITRRIDELGRVVIPKEIRKNLHIKQGDMLEIFLSSSNVISLKKYSILNNNEELILNFITDLSKFSKCDIYVSDKDKIIFSSNNMHIDENIIDNLNLNNYVKLKEIKLTNNLILRDNFNIYKINPNGDLIGYVIFQFKNNEIDNELINFCIKYINKRLEDN